MRKTILLPLLAAVTLLAAGGVVWAARGGDAGSNTAQVIGPTAPQVREAEALRHVPGSQVRDVTLTAAPATVNLGERTVRTWAFNGRIPGPTIRIKAGDVVRARVRNQLPEPLTVHWHGIALRNDMDGVPGLNQRSIVPGAGFTYEFTAPHPGTYWYHPHTGTQLDRGLYGALIVDEPTQGQPMRDLTLMLDDWIDGTGSSPDDVLAHLKAGGADMPGMDMGGTDMPGMNHGGMNHGGMNMRGAPAGPSPLGADTADLTYPLYLVNGREPAQPATYPVTAGEKVRLRLINAAAATPFRVAFGGGSMRVVATDGYPVTPVATDALLLGMGERYDVEITVPRDGAFPFVALAEGKGMQALAVLRARDGTPPAPAAHPPALDSNPLPLDQLRSTAEVRLPAGTPDRTYQVALTGDMMTYRWGVNAPKRGGVDLPVKSGERIRLELTNNTAMWHPIHLHGHTFQVVNGSGDGPRKDTVIVPPGGKVTVEFIADNPGQWMLHCHNAYHAEAGMTTTLSYVA